MPAMEGTPEDALEDLLLIRRGSTMVGESRPEGRFKNISPSGFPWGPETLIAMIDTPKQEGELDE